MKDQLKKLYEFYWEIKTAVAVYETNFNKIPAELLNELRNAFDHVARCYVLYGLESDRPSLADIERQIDKSQGHLERLHLDLYKLFILENKNKTDYIKMQIEKELSSVRDLPYPLPDITKFQGWFNVQSHRIDDIVILAKKEECNQKTQ